MESLVREVGWLMTEEDGGCGKTCVFRVGFYCLCIGEIESGRVEMEIALGDFLCVFFFCVSFCLGFDRCIERVSEGEKRGEGC